MNCVTQGQIQNINLQYVKQDKTQWNVHGAATFISILTSGQSGGC